MWKNAIIAESLDYSYILTPRYHVYRFTQPSPHEQDVIQDKSSKTKIKKFGSEFFFLQY